MPGFLATIGSLFLYKEPKNEELGFELLEDENEGNEENNTENKNKKSSAALDESQKSENSSPPKNNSDTISKQLSVNLETINQKFAIPKNQDVIIREFKVGRKVKAFILFIEGMVDKQTLNLAIFPQLMAKDVLDELGSENTIDYLMDNVLTVNKVEKTNKYSELIIHVLNGLSALFVEGCGDCVIIECSGYEKRSIDKPSTEPVVKGSQEAFTEDLQTNVSLIRRIIKNENLVTELLPIGNTNHSNCNIIYLEGVANPKVIDEVKKRIQRINADFIMGDGMIEQFIEDNPFMLFPQVLTTERPDRTASFIMEGQVVIIGGGAPFSIAVPVTFFHLFHTSEDTFTRWPTGTFLRLIRMFGLFCATLLPGLYIAAILFHPEMLPTELLSSIAKAKETVPFPTVVEVMILEVSFELIREGGIRVPTVIGQTLGIVGALILGQAAVAAGLVSPIMVIIVAVTALGSFAIPNYEMGLAIRVERFLFIFAGGFFGFYGITLMLALMAYLICSMKSFGVPFLTPVAPKTKASSDVIIQYPIWTQKNRPDALNTPNRKKQGNNTKAWITEKDKGPQDGGNNP